MQPGDYVWVNGNSIDNLAVVCTVDNPAKTARVGILELVSDQHSKPGVSRHKPIIRDGVINVDLKNLMFPLDLQFDQRQQNWLYHVSSMPKTKVITTAMNPTTTVIDSDVYVQI